MGVMITILLCIGVAQCVPPSPTSIMTDELKAEIGTVKNAIKLLSDQWEKFNTLFVTSLEPRFTSTASTLASIDSNIHNLQERAHVWDTFQLHVSAWNEQLASLDRKVDIISKGQEKILSLDNKINTILAMEYKLDNTVKTLNNVQEVVNNLDEILETRDFKTARDSLLNEFTTRGVLSSIKTVEKKLDRLLLVNQNNLLKPKTNGIDKPKLQIKCNTPKIVEDLLNDISSKVDVIFDSLSTETKNSIDDTEYDNEYIDLIEGSGDDLTYKQQANTKHLRKVIRRAMLPCKQTNQALEEILTRTIRIENASLVILDKENTHFEKLTRENLDSKILDNIRKKSDELNKNVNIILESYFSEQRVHFENILNKFSRKVCDNKQIFKSIFLPTILPEPSIATPTSPTTTTSKVQTTANKSFITDDLFEVTTASSILFDDIIPISTVEEVQASWKPIINESKSSCEDLSFEDNSGVYIFMNNSTNMSEIFSNRRYCEMREDGLWTVFQRRDNYTAQHNFNVSWEDYKYGFGDLDKDFWMGNEFLYLLSQKYNLVLRIELQDFENNSVWAEYDSFKIDSEGNNYRLAVGGYTGNASDSLSTHNGAYFSTFDKTNDEAPECCPCAVSYGGGWWFNRCFESNLNGPYYKQPNSNHYFRGIIWEHWLGNYSLKKTVMMLKSKGKILYTDPVTTKMDKSMNEEYTTVTIPYYEDP